MFISPQNSLLSDKTGKEIRDRNKNTAWQALKKRDEIPKVLQEMIESAGTGLGSNY